MRQPASLLQGLEQAGILAVLRAPSAEHAVRAVDALVAGGVLGIEITYSTPDAADAIAEAARRHGDAIYLGAGTVLIAAQAHEAVEARDLLGQSRQEFAAAYQSASSDRP